MNKEETTLAQGIAIMYMFILGSNVVVGGVNEAQRDSWLTIGFGAIMVIPLILIYARFKKLFPSMDLYDILQWTLGKIFGKFITALYAGYAVYLGALVIRNFTEFLSAMSLPGTPQFVSAIMLGLVTIWAVKSGIATLGRWSIVFSILVTFVVCITLFLGISQYDIENVKPVAEKGISKLIEGGTSSLSFPFAETVLFLLALGKFKQGTNPYKMWFIALIVGCVILMLASLRNLLILGEEGYVNIYFTSYTSVMAITLGDFLSRFEIIIGTNSLLCGIVKVTICLLAATKGLSKLFNIRDYKKLAAPVGLFMMIFSIIVYSSLMEMFDWLNVYKYFAFPFQVIFPVLLWVIVEIKVKLYSRFKRPLPTA